MASKVFVIIGIFAFYIVTALFLSYAGFEYEGMAGFNIDNEETADLNPSVSNITIGGFFSILLGIFAFSITWIPYWISIILYLPLLAMLILIYELIRGV